MMFSYIRINCSRALDRNHSNGACRRTAFRAGLFRHGQPLGRRALAPGPTSRLRASHIGRYPAHLPLTDEEERNGPPQSASESHVFRADRSAPRPQHRHRVNLRGRPPLPLHHARRLRPARPGAVIRPDPGEWNPRMPERGSRHPLPPNHLLGENREPAGRIGEDGLEQVTCFFAVPPLTQQNPEPLSSRRDLQRLASKI